MSRTRIVKGKITEITGETSRIFGESIQINSNGRIDYFAQNYSYGDPKAPPVKILDGAVKEVELLTPLDLGSDNIYVKGTTSPPKTQLGMIFGNTYEFRVKSYVQNPPANLTSIKWMLYYQSPSQNKWVKVPLLAKGDIVKITMNDKDMCGRFVYVRSYVYNPDNEGEYKEWKHNRFRWFNRMFVEDEILERTDNGKPWLINQAGTSLCGMACIFYLFAKEQPDAYKKFAKELFRTGIATFNNYVVKPSIDVLEKEVDVIKNSKGHFKYVAKRTGGMSLVDYLTMAGTRNTDNNKYKGGDEEFQAINWPPLMTTLSEDLLGYKNVDSKGVYNPVKPIAYTTLDVENKINDINAQLKAGYRLILMIDSDLIDDQWDVDSLDLHWVVLESPITWNYVPSFLGAKIDEVDFKVYSWGTDPNGAHRYLRNKITSSHFINNYNGYIKVK